MKNIQTIFISLLLFISSRLIIAQEVDDQREFDYDQGSSKGPDQWGNLREEWATCRDGVMQSPIDLSNEIVDIVPHLGELKMKYKPSNATLRNRGHDIMLQWTGYAGSIEISGTNYKLVQSHWHTPSEHAIDGKRFDLEQHMVHQSTDPIFGTRIAVIGILYNIGRPEPFLSKLEKHIKSISGGPNEITVGMIDPRHIRISEDSYYRYMGSLTTPPCSESVTWTIDTRVRSVSTQQVELLKAAVHDYASNNARPLQPLNDREIFLYQLGGPWNYQDI
ncbi:hypothetical protein IFM89_016335 [Coptis chinensis]|uniref:Alpha-carbonic anhydrase domain-containing protein n=1 Tax=Coptis chinensis TaxID=261450 RepID=A0A835HD90_9MAGN|nr:hypothetical protein IFM89_016335 [Coptis chinensis]